MVKAAKINFKFGSRTLLAVEPPAPVDAVVRCPRLCAFVVCPRACPEDPTGVVGIVDVVGGVRVGTDTLPSE